MSATQKASEDVMISLLMGCWYSGVSLWMSQDLPCTPHEVLYEVAVTFILGSTQGSRSVVVSRNLYRRKYWLWSSKWFPVL